MRVSVTVCVVCMYVWAHCTRMCLSVGSHPACAVSAFTCSYHVHTECGVSLVGACAGPHEFWRSALVPLGPEARSLSLQALSESSTRAARVSVRTLPLRPTQAHAGVVDSPGGGPDGVQNGSE